MREAIRNLTIGNAEAQRTQSFTALLPSPLSAPPRFRLLLSGLNPNWSLPVDALAQGDQGGNTEVY